MGGRNESFLGDIAIAKHLEPLFKAPIADIISTLSIWQGVILLLCLIWGYSSLQVHRRIKVPGAPVHGYFSWFEPTWFLQLRYAKDAHKIIASGYEKYNTKNKPFVLRRQDLDVTVLPTKYIEELRTIPNAKLSRGKANFMVFHGDNSAYDSCLAYIDL
ncbi:hypothetical protein V8C42DRAFT_226064 [Trichoderma barbatum]